MTTKQQKALFYFYNDKIPGEVWLDDEGKIFRIVHDSDASWSAYHDFVAKAFGGKIVRIRDIIFDQMTDEEWSELSNLPMEELAEKLVKKFKKEIAATIKKALK